MPEQAPAGMPASDAGQATGMVEVGVRLFGVYRDRAGFGHRMLRLPDGATVSDTVDLLRGEPGLDVIPDRPLVAVNRTYAALTDVLAHGDELALIPPVAGG